MKDLEVWAIEWDDHCSNDDWFNRDSYKTSIVKAVSVGILIGQDKEAISLSLNLDKTNDNISCTMNILKKCITRSVRLCRLKDLKDMRQRRLK